LIGFDLGATGPAGHSLCPLKELVGYIRTVVVIELIEEMRVAVVDNVLVEVDDGLQFINSLIDGVDLTAKALDILVDFGQFVFGDWRQIIAFCM